MSAISNVWVQPEEREEWEASIIGWLEHGRTSMNGCRQVNELLELVLGDRLYEGWLNTAVYTMKFDWITSRKQQLCT